MTCAPGVCKRMTSNHFTILLMIDRNGSDDDNDVDNNEDDDDGDGDEGGVRVIEDASSIDGMSHGFHTYTYTQRREECRA